MPIKRYRNRDTGEVVELPWSGDRDPTPDDVDTYSRQQRNRSSISKGMDSLSNALTWDNAKAAGDAAWNLGAGALDVGKGVVGMFNPVRAIEPGQPDPLGLGFEPMTPARHIAEGMISSVGRAGSEIENARQNIVELNAPDPWTQAGKGAGYAALDLGELSGVPTRSAWDQFEQGNYARGLGQLGAGAALLYAGNRAHAKTKAPALEAATDAGIPGLGQARPIEAPTPSGVPSGGSLDAIDFVPEDAVVPPPAAQNAFAGYAARDRAIRAGGPPPDIAPPVAEPGPMAPPEPPIMAPEPLPVPPVDPLSARIAEATRAAREAEVAPPPDLPSPDMTPDIVDYTRLEANELVDAANDAYRAGNQELHDRLLDLAVEKKMEQRKVAGGVDIPTEPPSEIAPPVEQIGEPAPIEPPPPVEPMPEIPPTVDPQSGKPFASTLEASLAVDPADLQVIRDVGEKVPVELGNDPARIKAYADELRSRAAETPPPVEPPVYMQPEAPPAPKPKVTPDRKLRIMRGVHDPVEVVFPDRNHADLYSAVGRSRKQTGGRPGISPDWKGLAARFGVDDKTIGKMATEYRARVQDLVKGQPKEQPRGGSLSIEAPPFDAAPADAPLSISEFLKGEGGWMSTQWATDLIDKVKEKAEGAPMWFKSSNIERSNPNAVPILRDWMGKRAAAGTRGVLAGNKFRQFDNLPVDLHQGVSRQLVDIRNRAIAANAAHGLQEGFLHRMFEEDPVAVRNAFGSKYAKGDLMNPMTRKPGASPKSIIDAYKEGQQLGLTPKFNKTSELINWYENTMNRAMADAEMFTRLRKSGFLKPQKTAPYGWSKSNFFPSYGKAGVFTSEYRAHPDITKAIENYVNEQTGFFNKSGKAVGVSKDVALSSGLIPGTAINAHGLNITARNAAARGIVKGSLEGIGMLLNTGADNPIARGIEKVAPWDSARKILETNLADAPEFVEGGLNLSTEGFKFGEPRHGKPILTGLPILRTFGKYFEDPLFQNMIPALKIRQAKDLVAQFEKSGMNRKKAVQTASKITNEQYGGINTDMLFRSKSFQDVMRTFLIAPDWLESNVKVGKGMASAPFKKGVEAAPYKKMVAGFVGAYVLGNIANKTMSGHWMYQNDPGYTMQIDTGQTIKSGKKEKKAHLNPFGTAFDAIRLPAEAAAGLAQGDLSEPGRIAKNRISMPVTSIENYMYNEDWRGRELSGKDAYGRPIPFMEGLAREGTNFAQPWMPQPVSGAVDWMMGDISIPEAVLGAVEAPIRFSGVPRPKGGGKSGGRGGRKGR